MTTINQGMSVEKIKQVVAQLVANAIEVIAIYETKTNMVRKSISHTKREEDKVAENASNKRKWEGNHNGSSSQQNKGHKVPRAHTTRSIGKKAYAGSLPLCNQCKFHHNGPCTIKCKNCKKRGEIEFVTKLMDKKISTPAKRQDENKRKLDNTSKNNQKQQQPNKRQNTSRAYTRGHGEKKHYDGSKSSTNANIADNQRGTRASHKATCYKCGNQGHYMNDCPK
ncbi:reverse transcriptase domain-containing protein [Tanacetum coccineum]